MLWEVYSYAVAGAAGLPAASADLLMLSSLSDNRAGEQSLPVSANARPGTSTIVYKFNGSAGLSLLLNNMCHNHLLQASN